MIASDIITAVRTDILNDATAPYRWTDDFMIRKLSDAQRELYRRRPDIGMGAATITIEPTALTALASTLTAPETWRGALMDYLAFRAFELDSEHADNLARSQHHLQLFATAIS